MLEQEHETLRHDTNDNNNNNALGRISEHNVVVACIPDGQTNTTSMIRRQRSPPDEIGVQDQVDPFGLTRVLSPGIPMISPHPDCQLPPRQRPLMDHAVKAICLASPSA